MDVLVLRAATSLAEQLFALALGLRLMTGLWWEKRLGEDTRFGFGDSETYWVLGQAIAEGKPYQFGSPELRCMRTPGYPVILAAIFRAADRQPPLFWARAVGAIWGTLAVGGVYWLARQLFGPPAALIAAIGAAIYPGAIAMSALILTEAGGVVTDLDGKEITYNREDVYEQGGILATNGTIHGDLQSRVAECEAEIEGR